MQSIRRMGGAILVVIPLALASGCEDSSEPTGTTTIVRDSAGIEIVRSEAPLWQNGEGWRTSAAPVLVVGSADGAEEYALYRVGAATKLPDGRIAVGNMGTSQVRLYDSTGTHVMDLGGRGDGPGEFRGLGGVWAYGRDSILVGDGVINRFTVFSGDGDGLRTISIAPGDDARQAYGMRPTRDGTLLVAAVVNSPGGRRDGLFEGPSLRFQHYGPDGTLLGNITQQAGGSRWGVTIQGRAMVMPVPFTSFLPPYRSNGRFVFVGSGRQPEIEQWSPEGALHRIVRWSEEPRRVTDAMVGRLHEEQLNGAPPEARDMARQVLEEMVLPEALPVYRRLLVDADDNIWVEQYRTDWEEERRWWVFDSTGRWLGEPQVPTDIDLREVGTDYLIGVRTGENDVEELVVLHLLRGG